MTEVLVSGQTQLWTHHYLSIPPFGNPLSYCKKAQTALWSVSSRKNVNPNKFSWAPSHQPGRDLLATLKRNLENESSNLVLSKMTMYRAEMSSPNSYNQIENHRQICFCWVKPLHLMVVDHTTITSVSNGWGGASGKEPTCQSRRHRYLGSIRESRRFPGGG